MSKKSVCTKCGLESAHRNKVTNTDDCFNPLCGHIVKQEECLDSDGGPQPDPEHPIMTMLLKRCHEAQPNPNPTDGPSMHDLARVVMDYRYQSGLNTYGKPLQAFNGRDYTWDRVEECADAFVYAIGDWIERQELLTELAELRAELKRQSAKPLDRSFGE